MLEASKAATMYTLRVLPVKCRQGAVTIDLLMLYYTCLGDMFAILQVREGGETCRGTALTQRFQSSLFWKVCEGQSMSATRRASGTTTATAMPMPFHTLPEILPAPILPSMGSPGDEHTERGGGARQRQGFPLLFTPSLLSNFQSMSSMRSGHANQVHAHAHAHEHLRAARVEEEPSTSSASPSQLLHREEGRAKGDPHAGERGVKRVVKERREERAAEKEKKRAGRSEQRYDDVPTNEASTSSGKRDPGRWTQEEHLLFLKGLELHGKSWKKISEIVKTRTVVQIRTHAQKYLIKLEKAKKTDLKPSMNTDTPVSCKLIPPPPSASAKNPSSFRHHDKAAASETGQLLTRRSSSSAPPSPSSRSSSTSSSPPQLSIPPSSSSLDSHPTSTGNHHTKLGAMHWALPAFPMPHFYANLTRLAAQHGSSGYPFTMPLSPASHARLLALSGLHPPCMSRDQSTSMAVASDTYWQGNVLERMGSESRVVSPSVKQEADAQDIRGQDTMHVAGVDKASGGSGTGRRGGGGGGGVGSGRLPLTLSPTAVLPLAPSIFPPAAHVNTSPVVRDERQQEQQVPQSNPGVVVLARPPPNFKTQQSCGLLSTLADSKRRRVSRGTSPQPPLHTLRPTALLPLTCGGLMNMMLPGHGYTHGHNPYHTTCSPLDELRAFLLSSEEPSSESLSPSPATLSCDDDIFPTDMDMSLLDSPLWSGEPASMWPADGCVGPDDGSLWLSESVMDLKWLDNMQGPEACAFTGSFVPAA